MGLPGCGWLPSCALGFGLVHMGSKRCDDASRDVILDGKKVFELAVIAFCPAVRASRGINELGADAHAVAASAGAALHYIPHTKLPADLAYVGRFALVLKAGAPRDHE